MRAYADAGRLSFDKKKQPYTNGRRNKTFSETAETLVDRRREKFFHTRNRTRFLPVCFTFGKENFFPFARFPLTDMISVSRYQITRIE